MANKRDTAAQKRARENRAQREARQARTKAASTPRPSRVAPAAKPGAATGKRVGRFGAPGQPKPPRRPRLGDAPVDVETLQGSYIRRLVQVPGGSQVTMALAISALSAFLAATGKSLAPEGKVLSKKVKPTRSLIDAYSVSGAALRVLIPVAIIAVAFALGLSPKRRRVWLVATLLLALVFFLGGVIYIYFLFPLGLMVYGLYRANKIEGPQPLFGGRGRASRAATDDGDATTESVDEG